MENKIGSKFNNVVQQFKGAGKLVFVITIALSAMNIWILKDDKHVSLVITNDYCQTEVMEKQALMVYGEMNGK